MADFLLETRGLCRHFRLAGPWARGPGLKAVDGLSLMLKAGETLGLVGESGVQRNASNVKEAKVAFIGINQVRDKIGAYISTFETPGGHAWKHILSLRIQLSKAEDIKVPVEGEKDNVIGINTRFTIKKNKLSAPLKTFFIPIIFGEGIDSYRDVIQFAEVLGVLTKAGAYYTLGEDTIGQGMNKTIQYLKENKDTLDKITKLCYDTVKE